MQKGKLSATFNKLSASYHLHPIGVTLGAIGLLGGILIHAPLAVVFGAAAVGLFGLRTFAGPPPIPEQKIGDKMPDGTIYAGISPETKQPMYAALTADEIAAVQERTAKREKEHPSLRQPVKTP